ncbi:MAG TPA: 50S ribosomal protein L9 [Synergistaceae bacterium]|jgi:large subunit ribosomal protein L9|uniref:50S ribosomal protein L9 n=1 Tax=Synergistaceae TaxID=649777 RepID=UPI000EF0688A|nr:50S ribosomal protein L9 [Synergistaceae bacterium DZ-S4]HAH69493.1 50S ribosomal protein L9 [Synergistaceae bacterium]
MKVILKQDVNKIGKKGDLLEVADGYGRNFLIARGLAEEATEGKIRELQQMQMTQKIKDDKKLKIAEESKKKLGGKVVRIKVNTGEGGKLFGSVTNAQIADALTSQYGVPVDKKDLKIEETVKQTGEYRFKVKLYAGVDAEMTLKVESE